MSVGLLQDPADFLHAEGSGHQKLGGFFAENLLAQFVGRSFSQAAEGRIKSGGADAAGPGGLLHTGVRRLAEKGPGGLRQRPIRIRLLRRHGRKQPVQQQVQ